MTRIVKLYDQLLLDRRRLSFAEFQKLIEAFGYRLNRIKGSHHTYRHFRIGERMQIQPNGKEAKDYQVAQFLAIVVKHRLVLDEEE